MSPRDAPRLPDPESSSLLPTPRSSLGGGYTIWPGECCTPRPRAAAAAEGRRPAPPHGSTARQASHDAAAARRASAPLRFVPSSLSSTSARTALNRRRASDAGPLAASRAARTSSICRSRHLRWAERGRPSGELGHVPRPHPASDSPAAAQLSSRCTDSRYCDHARCADSCAPRHASRSDRPHPSMTAASEKRLARRIVSMAQGTTPGGQPAGHPKPVAGRGEAPPQLAGCCKTLGRRRDGDLAPPEPAPSSSKYLMIFPVARSHLATPPRRRAIHRGSAAAG